MHTFLGKYTDCYTDYMSKNTINEQTLRIGTAFIWGAVLIGVSLLTDSGDRALDWQLMWVIVGGFLIHSILLNAYLRNHKDK